MELLVYFGQPSGRTSRSTSTVRRLKWRTVAHWATVSQPGTVIFILARGGRYGIPFDFSFVPAYNPRPLIIFYHFWKQNELYLPDPTGSRLFSWPQYWAACFGPAPFLPMHVKRWINLAGIAATSFWLLARVCRSPKLRDGDLRSYAGSEGFRVGIIAQPDWSSKDDFMVWVNRICFSVLLLATWTR